MKNILYLDKAPSFDAYIKLRKSVKFIELTEHTARKGFENSYFIVSAYDEVTNECVGIARLISDGGYVNFISDVIVHPTYQGLGIGKHMVQRILDFLYDGLEQDDKVAVYLMSAKGKEPFYTQIGFQSHPNEKKGAGMSLWLKKK